MTEPAPRALLASLTARLALLSVAVFILVLSGIGAFLYAFLDRELRERDRAELDGKRELVRQFVGRTHSRAELLSVEGQLRDALVGHGRLHVVLVDAGGAILFSAAGASAEPALVDAGLARIAAGGTGPYLVDQGTMLQATTERVTLGDPGRTAVWAIVALDTTENRQLLATYLRGLVIVLLTGAVLAGLAGLAAIRRGLRPIGRIAAAAEHVSASRLEDRIALRDTPTELVRLVQSFNAMLARLADSFRRLSEFSSDLAHELRTPLHSLLGHAQVALSRPRSAEEYRLTIETVVEEAERLARTVRDMLFLAQADNASLAVARDDLDLRQEVDAVVSFFQALVDEERITLAVNGSGRTIADRHMVQRAVSNLLSNALRHTGKEGAVDVRVSSSAEEGVIEVSNTGPAIPADVLPRLFDRFYRGGESWRRADSGTGLGLAIVKSIMELHGGTVEVASGLAAPTVFRLRFSRVAVKRAPSGSAR